MLNFDTNYFFTNEYFLGIQVGFNLGSTTSVNFGPQVGYDWHFVPNYSIGAEAQLTFNTGSVVVGNLGAVLVLKMFLN